MYAMQQQLKWGLPIEINLILSLFLGSRDNIHILSGKNVEEYWDRQLGGGERIDIGSACILYLDDLKS